MQFKEKILSELKIVRLLTMFLDRIYHVAILLLLDSKQHKTIDRDSKSLVSHAPLFLLTIGQWRSRFKICSFSQSVKSLFNFNTQLWAYNLQILIEIFLIQHVHGLWWVALVKLKYFVIGNFKSF